MSEFLKEINVLPAYNIKSKHHPKSANWVGYLINFDGLKIYVTGDCDATSEAKKVKCDILLLPIGGTYTMDYQEAAMLTNTINPIKVIPTHYGYVVGSINDAKNFKKLINKNIKCELLIRK